jgi:hypothetical protein
MKASKTETVPADVQSFCERLVTNKRYRSLLEVKFIERTLPVALETMIWSYAAGKPPQKIDLSVTDDSDIRNASKDELLTRLKELQAAALELEEHPTEDDIVH